MRLRLAMFVLGVVCGFSAVAAWHVSGLIISRAQMSIEDWRAADYVMRRKVERLERSWRLDREKLHDI